MKKIVGTTLVGLLFSAAIGCGPSAQSGNTATTPPKAGDPAAAPAPGAAPADPAAPAAAPANP